ncbi:hypothetical protein K443DRAFT_152854 [Laccaria amethystina LaAM-08-1]|uniref:Uncharacterized protein n=1 Tax=Laccaria amethystina LaAM-08-1 TaxID=1095629 RepID=A0A0C9X6N9_9AGAR|nr:hypothetical protein K443DRAFT_152854 [Laccaria amethystina LaAM-08-1]
MHLTALKRNSRETVKTLRHSGLVKTQGPIYEDTDLYRKVKGTEDTLLTFYKKITHED